MAPHGHLLAEVLLASLKFKSGNHQIQRRLERVLAGHPQVAVAHRRNIGKGFCVKTLKEGREHLVLAGPLVPRRIVR